MASERYILKSREHPGYQAMVVRGERTIATLFIHPDGCASDIIGLHYAEPHCDLRRMVAEFDEPATRAHAVLRYIDRVERESMECPHTGLGYCFPDTSMSQPQLVHASMSERWRKLEGWAI